MATSNTEIQFKGEPTEVTGNNLSIGDSLPSFKLTANDLSDLDSSVFAGKVLVICSMPSLDTPVCDIETKRFNEEAAKLSDDVVVLVVTKDLPFAQKRWCAASDAENITTASDYKYQAFGEDFGVTWKGPQLLARAIFVADKSGKLAHVEYVGDIATEPDYEAAISKVAELV